MHEFVKCYSNGKCDFYQFWQEFHAPAERESTKKKKGNEGPKSSVHKDAQREISMNCASRGHGSRGNVVSS